MKRIILAVALLLGLFEFAGVANAAVCNVPNPNLTAPPFVDNCPLPAATLNKLLPTTVASNAALIAINTASFSAGQQIARQGFTTAGDGGAASYIFSTSSCTLNTGAGDNGSQVKPTAGGGCWLANFKVIPPNLIQFGADPTNTNDSGPAFQAAYTALAGVEDCVFVPAGTYLISTGTTMTGAPPCFRGVKPNEAQGGGTKNGTWLHIASTAVLPFTLSTNITNAGLGGFFDMAFFNDQPTNYTSWTPLAYQYIFTVQNGGQGLSFKDLYFYNTTHCISLYNTGRVTIDDIRGQPVGTCILSDLVQDITLIDHIDFWPFALSDSHVATYTETNVDPIVFERSDSPMIGRVFAYAYHSGIKFASSVNGSTTGFQISDLIADAVKYGIWVTGNNTQGQIANFRSAGGDCCINGVPIAGSEAYRDESTSGSEVAIGNFDNFFNGSSVIHITLGGNLMVGNPEFWNYNGDNNGSAAVKVDATGRVQLANAPSITGTINGGAVSSIASTGVLFAPGVAQSWSPILTGTSGTGTYTPVLAQGSFWDDGTKVHLTFNISVSSFTGFTGNLAIQGLPRPRTGLANDANGCSILSQTGWTGSGARTVLYGLLNGGSGLNQILLSESGSANASILAPAADFASTFAISGQCDYRWF